MKTTMNLQEVIRIKKDMVDLREKNLTIMPVSDVEMKKRKDRSENDVDRQVLRIIKKLFDDFLHSSSRTIVIDAPDHLFERVIIYDQQNCDFKHCSTCLSERLFNKYIKFPILDEYAKVINYQFFHVKENSHGYLILTFTV